MVGEWDVRIDPWAVEYGAETPGAAATDVEPDEQVDRGRRASGGRVAGAAGDVARPQAPVYFVDGVRRIDARLVVTRGAQVIHGALGSFGIGAVPQTVRRPRLPISTWVACSSSEAGSARPPLSI